MYPQVHALSGKLTRSADVLELEAKGVVFETVPLADPKPDDLKSKAEFAEMFEKGMQPDVPELVLRFCCQLCVFSCMMTVGSSHGGTCSHHRQGAG